MGEQQAERVYKAFVGGLTSDFSDADLIKEFEEFGATKADVLVDKMTQRSRGFGFVFFQSRAGMEDAIKGKHRTMVRDKEISVREAIPEKDIPPGGRQRDKWTTRGGGGGGYGGGYRGDRGGGGYDRGYERGGGYGGYRGDYDRGGYGGDYYGHQGYYAQGGGAYGGGYGGAGYDTRAGYDRSAYGGYGAAGYDARGYSGGYAGGSGGGGGGGGYGPERSSRGAPRSGGGGGSHPYRR